MTEPMRPDPTKVYGRDNWVLIPSVADINAITVTEWNAASSFDVTNVLFASTAKPTQSTNVVSAARRLGDTRTRQNVGETTVSGGEMRYAFADQAAAASDGKKLYEAIPEFTTAVLANRRGIPKATAGAAGQFYHAYEVEFGPSFPADEGDGESAEAAMVCTFAVSGDVAINKVIAA